MNENDKMEVFRSAVKKQLEDARHEGYDQGFLDAFWVVLKVSDEPNLIALLMDDWLSLADAHRDIFEELQSKANGSKDLLKDVLYKLRWAISEQDLINNKDSIDLIDEAIEHYCN